MASRDPDQSLDTLYLMTLVRISWVLAGVYVVIFLTRVALFVFGIGLTSTSGQVFPLGTFIAGNLPATLGYATTALVFRRLPCRPWTVDGIGLALVGVGCLQSQLTLALTHAPIRYLVFTLIIVFAGVSFRRTPAFALALLLVFGNVVVASFFTWPDPISYFGVMMGFATIFSVAAHQLVLWLNQRSVRLMRRYRRAVSEVRTLRGLIPLCAGCRKLRNEQGGWDRLETYMERHTEADITHGLCPECAEGMKAQIQEFYPRAADPA